MRICLVARAGLELVTFRSQSRRFPSTPHMSTNYWEENTLESSSNEIEQHTLYVRTARQSKRDVLQFLPIISKFLLMFKDGFLPLIIHPPPDHNAMLAFPQKKISHYTTAKNY